MSSATTKTIALSSNQLNTNGPDSSSESSSDECDEGNEGGEGYGIILEYDPTVPNDYLVHKKALAEDKRRRGKAVIIEKLNEERKALDELKDQERKEALKDGNYNKLVDMIQESTESSKRDSVLGGSLGSRGRGAKNIPAWLVAEAAVGGTQHKKLAIALSNLVGPQDLESLDEELCSEVREEIEGKVGRKVGKCYILGTGSSREVVVEFDGRDGFQKGMALMEGRVFDGRRVKVREIG